MTSHSLPSKADLALKAEQAARYVKDLWITLACVLTFLTLYRFIRCCLWHSLRPSRRITSTTQHDERQTKASLRLTKPFCWRSLPDAIATAFRIVVFRSTVWIGFDALVTVAEFFLIIGYISLMLLFVLIDTRRMEVVFWEDRAAIIASCQLPLVVALAGKNNLLTLFVGIAHEKLNVLHRSAARTVLLLLWMHAMQRYSVGIPDDWAISTTIWMQCGVLALCAISLTAIISARFVRNMTYELFAVVHNVCIAVFLLAGFFHTRAHGYDHFLWPTFIVWGLDRVLRLARIVLNWGGGKASVEILGNDIVRVAVPTNMKWKPGQHAYITAPSVSRLPTEAHPFTIASVTKRDQNGKAFLIFLIRRQSGFTKRLFQKVQSSAGDIAVYVDGPYGQPPNLKQFTTCILVAGGSGISYILPLLLDLIDHVKSATMSCQRVLFVWTVRHSAHLRWVSNTLGDALASCPDSLVVDVYIHVTGPLNASALVSSTSLANSMGTSGSREKAPSSVQEKRSQLKIVSGRPNMEALLQEEIVNSLGPISVDVAGPPGLTSSIRTALTANAAGPRAVLRGVQPVVLHVETFGMVKH